jgi:hypothetical protein
MRGSRMPREVEMGRSSNALLVYRQQHRVSNRKHDAGAARDGGYAT